MTGTPRRELDPQQSFALLIRRRQGASSLNTLNLFLETAEIKFRETGMEDLRHPSST